MTDPTRRWQFGLRALILIVPTVAVWLTSHVNRRQSERIQARIRVLEPLAHQLRIDDPAKVAVVRLGELWIDDNRWDVFLPSGEYRVCLATRGITEKGLPAPQKTATIAMGRHRLEFQVPIKSPQRSLSLSSEGWKLLDLEEAKEWGFSGNSSGGASFSTTTQLPSDEAVVLYRRIFMVPNGPNQTIQPTGPADGIMLWIERIKPETAPH